MNTAQTPSLLNPSATGGYAAYAEERSAKTLLDLLYDGFMMLFLVKSGQEPTDAPAFSLKIQHFLNDFERQAKKLDIANEDVYATKYAFCAAVDETVLNSNFVIRDKWMLQPLQLTLFGDQLAGENFFARLEDLRAQGAPRLQSLVFLHMCQLVGFQGK
jgi:type VI secretion system protein ImpK